MIGLSFGVRNNRKFDQMMWQTASLSYKFVSFSDVSQNAQGSIFGPLKNPNNIYSPVANMNSYSWQKFVSLQYTNFLERCDIALSGLAFDCCFFFFLVLLFRFLFLFLFLFEIVRQPEDFALLACQLYMLLCFSALFPFVSSLFTLTLCRRKASEGIKLQLLRGTYSARTSHSKEEWRSRKAIHILNGNHIFLSFLEPLSHNLSQSFNNCHVYFDPRII